MYSQVLRTEAMKSLVSRKTVVSSVYGFTECCEIYFLQTESLTAFVILTCDQAFFFRRCAKEKQSETRRSAAQSGFSRVTILSRSSKKRTPDRRLLSFRVKLY